VKTGTFLIVFKSTYITLRLKKTSLDPADTRWCGPISNLPVLSKTLERLVALQLLDHVNLWTLMPDLQSTYRVNHSTETAVLRVLSDILDALDRGHFALSPLTMPLCCTASRQRMPLPALHWSGSLHTFTRGRILPVQKSHFNSIVTAVWNVTRIGPPADTVPSVYGRLPWTH